MTQNDYTPNAGQTYLPVEDNILIKPLPFVPLNRPQPPIADPVLNPMALERKWQLKSACQHFLPGVSSEMIDWFWANMEKGYYLWAPGSHKRFSWVRAPWQYGFLHSAHMISETTGEGRPVFGGSGIQINRLPLDYFPFTKALRHVIVEGVFNDLDEFVDMTVHMWEDCPGGCRHLTASVVSTTVHEPPAFIKKMLAENPDALKGADVPSDHAEYEASRWPVFLPTLYRLWQGHPDPSQNVACCLAVEQKGEYSWSYTHENGPVEIGVYRSEILR